MSETPSLPEGWTRGQSGTIDLGPVCPTCSARVADLDAHAAWHERERNRNWIGDPR